MSKELKKGKQDSKAFDGAEKVVVAVKASKDIPKTALVWALTHVVQPGHCITLLVVVPSQTSGRRLWGFPLFAGDCHRKSYSGNNSDEKFDITDTCSQMILQLHEVYDPNKVNVKIKIVSGSPYGAVAVEANRIKANWVVLDKHLKNEEKRCMEELQCNIVSMKRSQPKVLRLNLVGSSNYEPEQIQKDDTSVSTQSPEPFTTTEAGTSSVSSSDPEASPLKINEKNTNPDLKKISLQSKDHTLEESCSETESENPSSCSSSLRFQPWKALLEKFSKLDEESELRTPSYRSEVDYTGNVREVISFSKSAPLGPPPLCSLCQHKGPEFGKPPRFFTYNELELATEGFSEANFLAEGGFGSVHRGVLPDGQVVAVKQHKLASCQGDQEFCSEVEVLSCAQHRNVVTLIGFCIEDGRRLLVYEYICNGSLDYHLYGRDHDPLEWSARAKIAIGAARGLRYLHEECRVGCIVHRDMRPNNILITHDFEPMVGDFGLARWQPDGDTGVETRVIGTFGYLAPEYAQTGQITDKADVYSFGVVLVELVTGRKAVDLNRPKGQQCLTEWARPLLEEYAIEELVDPRVGKNYSEQEVYCMLHAASLCIRQDPQTRPRMSQVLRILEGDGIMDSSYLSTPMYDGGERSSRRILETPERFHQKHFLDTRRAAYWEREKARTSYEDL